MDGWYYEGKEDRVKGTFFGIYVFVYVLCVRYMYFGFVNNLIGVNFQGEKDQ